MQVHIGRPRAGLRGEVAVPGDKSISHRAAILGALGEGRTEIDGFLPGADCLATLSILGRLGAKIDRPAATRVTVTGCGGQLTEPADILDARNSGTTTRLMLGVLAGQPFTAILTGDASLRRRPMRRVTDPLGRMGASFLGRSNADRLPLAVQGSASLRPGEFRLPVASAQVKSALLLAGLQADGWTSVSEPVLSRDHTERLLPSFGVELCRNGTTVTVKGPANLVGTQVSVPGDPSSALFSLVAASLVPGSELLVKRVGLNPTRTGALEVLRRMGADLRITDPSEVNGEPCGTIAVKTAAGLRGVEVAPKEIPALLDEVPVLAVAAAYAQGTTTFLGAGELRAKETDRLAVVKEELGRLGAKVSVEGDTLCIVGAGGLRGGAVRAHGDHRIAMSLAVAGLAAGSGVTISGAECVDVSFPGFYSSLGQVAPGSLS
jgi:3-phosphoshikimate 1-carboxyvinyltransferase